MKTHPCEKTGVTGTWRDLLWSWELKRYVMRVKTRTMHDLSSCYGTPLPFGSASPAPANLWPFCEAHRGSGSGSSCVRRSLRCCLKANWNPFDTAVSCHFSHKFENSFWYGGLFRIATEQSTWSMIWLSLPITTITGLLSLPSLPQNGSAPLTHLICCLQSISLPRKFQIKHRKP